MSEASEGLHVAIIMDGNGRWAQARGQMRGAGHKQGVETLRNIIKAAQDLKLACLTVYSFSTENWSRPEMEVEELFQLLRVYVAKDLDRLRDEGVCVKVLGSRQQLPDDILAIIEKVEARTASNDKFQLNIAFNYGAREEITQAVKAYIADGYGIDELSEARFAQYLYTAHCADPDLIIRTSGEQRLSNFLLWQAAYAEMFFTDTLWPEFTAQEFEDIINSFKDRERRFGGLNSASALAQPEPEVS